MRRRDQIWVASVLLATWTIPITAQNNDAARISAHIEQEKKLVSEANSASAQALDLRLKGRLAEAVAQYRKAAMAYEAIVMPCGKVEGRVTWGCAYDESTLGSAVADLAGALHDQGKIDAGVRVFTETLARLETRWSGCGTAAWGFDCAEAAYKRRVFLTHNARALENAARRDAALAIRRRILSEQEVLLASCSAENCETAADEALTAYTSVRDTLRRADQRDEMLALDEAWLPRLAMAPLYVAGKQAGAGYTAKGYADTIDAVVKDMAALGSPAANSLLHRLDRTDVVAARSAQTNYDAQVAELEGAYRAVSFTNFTRRSQIRAEQARIVGLHQGSASRQYGEALSRVGAELLLAKNWTAAADALRQSLAIHRRNEPADNFRVLRAAEQLARALVSAGQPAAAITALTDVLADPATDKMALYTDPARNSALAYGTGDRNGLLNGLKAQQAELLLAYGGDPALAVAAARHAAVGVSAYRAALGAGIDDEENRERAERSPEWATGEPRFGAFSSLYADALWAAGRRDQMSRDEAFGALQEATGGTTTSALAKSAADQVAVASGAGKLLTRRRKLTESIKRISQIDAADEAARKQTYYKQARLNDERNQLDTQIATVAPDYFALIHPKPLTSGEAQKMLGVDEAALIALPSRFGTHLLLVTREGIDWQRAELTEAQLTQHVRRLLWDVGGNVEVTPAEEQAWGGQGQGAFPFDRGTAYLLYRQLVAPFAAKLAGKRHLFVVGGGSLASLPFSLLVAEPPRGADGDPQALRRTAWLADQIALAQLPSLQSLQLLRLVAARGAAPKGVGLLGYGSPVLDGKAATRGIAGPGNRGGSPTVPAAAALATSSTGAPLADVDRLRQLARLPGTAEELQAMRLAFGTNDVRLRTGQEATETRLKAEKLTGLTVLAFATHGLLAGEAERLGGVEPGLVLTPPGTASLRDDGLLTASEIAALQIGAEWVVLSACNTAAGDGSSGATGLSGLARSFFFAGARSLLASHWPVRDDVAAVLTVEVLRQQAAHPQWSRAEALRAAMKAIRDDPRVDGDEDTWAHPSAWAPFTFIGDWRG